MVLPKRESIIIACLVALIGVLFSSWLLVEVVLLMVVLSFAIRGVIWPNDKVKEHPVWFGCFWGLLVGILGYPVWEATGIINLVPKILGKI
ncbi:hypothetical protein [Zhongshania aquimaris]|uniref:Phosphatidate cytidylyltransferase n=1 Tax=Zhongshania aquimaris TaxID=2857107 RepID=A0ABS6VVN1_9GAMM|nr:hypothetical protein [Zhongshania aquimaris]MBW2941755.1 hypothetical protein [Zhongshania aquimaris]